MVGPAQAKRKVGLTTLYHLIEGALKHLFSPKPIVIIAETSDTCLTCQIRLLLPNFWKAKIVKT